VIEKLISTESPGAVLDFNDMCINPQSLKQKELIVPCGKCYICLKRRSNQWVFRLMEEAKASSSVQFHTYTYEETPKTKNGLDTLLKKDFQDYMKRLRKANTNKLRYYACGEYGTLTKRPHYHAIIFNLPLNSQSIVDQAWQYHNSLENHRRGLTHIVPGNELTIKYVTKYLLKGQFNTIGKGEVFDTDTGEVFQDDRQREFSLMSKGMGKEFMTPQMIKYIQQSLSGSIKLDKQHIAIPRYYRDKIFNQEQKDIISKKNEIKRLETEKTLKEWTDHVENTKMQHRKAIFNQRNKI